MPKVFLPFVNQSILYSNKFGIGAGGGEFAHHSTRSGVRRSWTIRTPVYHGVECVPCIWGRDDVRRIQNGQPIQGNSEWIIGFNETDRPDQSNLIPSEAITLWHIIENHPSTMSYKLTSPSQFFDPEFIWLREFIDLYDIAYGMFPRFNAMDLHCYSDNTKTDRKMVRRAISLAQELSIPEIWISEFQYGHWIPDGVEWKMRDFMKFLLDQPMVTKAFWFCGYVRDGTPDYPPGWHRPNLVNMENDPVMTGIGTVYRDMCLVDIGEER